MYIHVQAGIKKIYTQFMTESKDKQTNATQNTVQGLHNYYYLVIGATGLTVRLKILYAEPILKGLGMAV